MSRGSFGYKPALDGVRAVAVAAVIAYHLDAGWAKGGFLGVDTFFVLSGYLITGLLLSEREREGEIRLRAFWVRRARRLLPAILLLLAVVAGWAAWQMARLDLGKFRTDALCALGYIANWRFVVSGRSYFDLFRAPSPLGHLWSLAIEEQFYLVWPFVVFACLRRARGRRTLLAAVASGGLVASVVLMAVLYHPADPSRSYYGTDTRAHSLLVGALLAMVLHGRELGERTRAVLRWASPVAATLLIVSFATIGDHASFMYRGGFLGFAVAVAVLVAAMVQPEASPVKAVLSHPWMRWVGAVSYGLYLWHWPAIVVLTSRRTGLDGAALTVARLATTVGFTVASYYLIEQPIRHGALRAERGVFAVAAAFPAVAAVIIASTAGAVAPPDFVAGKGTLQVSKLAAAQAVDATEGPAFVTPSVLGREVTAGETTTVPAAVPGTGVPSTASAATETTEPSQPSLPSAVPASSTPASPAAASTSAPAAPTLPATLPKVIGVVGDSVATSLIWGLEDVATPLGVGVAGASVPGCGATAGLTLDDQGRPFSWSAGCTKAVPQLQTQLVRTYNPQLIVWLSSWETADRLVAGKRIHFGTPEGDAELMTELAASYQRLTRRGARLVILTLPPTGPTSVTAPTASVLANQQHMNELLTQFAFTHAGNVRLIDFGAIVCPGGSPCPETIDGVQVRPDGAHFDKTSSPWVAKRLLPLVVAP